jgi:hypothetical protein
MLRISDNRRFLAREDGSPFFYLADTAWELFHRLNREQADLYLRHRAAQGFTAVQAVVLAELDGLTVPNALGHLPLHDADPTRPVEDYFRHVDWIVDRAGELGLAVAMLPTWGDKWNRRWGAGPEIFTPSSAAAFGEFHGARYRDRHLLWILGGDRTIDSAEHLEITRAMARGLRTGDLGRHLVSFHPCGQHTSAEWLHCEPWLDFNMCQTGHAKDRDCYRSIALDYARYPAKPCLNGEPGYEHIPSGLKAGEPKLEADDVRKFLYWSLLAGAHGHTYGCNEVWQMWEPGRPPLFDASLPWHEALHLPGAGQMRHARTVLESRPYFSRLPDQSLLASDPGAGGEHIRACRDQDRTCALIYLPVGQEVRVHAGALGGEEGFASWLDPRTGSWEQEGAFNPRAENSFRPPTAGPGNDWLLVLDDASRGYAVPALEGVE